MTKIFLHELSFKNAANAFGAVCVSIRYKCNNYLVIYDLILNVLDESVSAVAIFAYMSPLICSEDFCFSSYDADLWLNIDEISFHLQYVLSLSPCCS